MLGCDAKSTYGDRGMECAGRSPTNPEFIGLIAGLWFWAIWACAEHWRGNPNYSYGWAVPLLAFGFALRRYFGGNLEDPGASARRRRDKQTDGRSETGLRDLRPTSLRFGIAVLASALFFALEFAREQIWHPEVVLWAICLLAVTVTLTALYYDGGRSLFRRELFPVLFFLTAVPWPPRFEQPIVSGLMRWVAETTTELLHWFGIEAQMSGAAIALRSGLVGISEACSGVRSLQAGLMFGLAMGEWFLLGASRRLVLLVIAGALALLTNLTRTLVLSLQAEWHGIASLDRVHDLIGNVMITTLIVLIWIGGKMLALDRSSPPTIAPQQIKDRAGHLIRNLGVSARSIVRPITGAFVIAIFSAHMLSTWLEKKDRTQTAPAFSVRQDSSNERRRIAPEIWNELRPTAGQAVRRRSAELPGGSADCFHFFWKPSPWNRFVLVHRPDICMPGIGWQANGSPEAVEVSLSGQQLRCYLFRFQRGDTYALELWGVWRNGEPVPLGYQPAQALGAAPPPPTLHLEGKRRSATEIIACTVIGDSDPPPNAIVVALFRSVFEYKPRE